MDTREIASEYRLTHWAQIMHERGESGLSVREFCKNAGIHENVYYYWQRKLRKAVCEQMARTPNENTSLIPAGFAEVMIAEAAPQSTLPEADGKISIETSGVRISADSTYPAEKLAALLRELTRPC